MRVLHFIPDEKFVDSAADLMTAVGRGTHIFAVNSDHPDRRLRFASRDRVAFVACSLESPVTLLRDELDRCDSLVIHYLNRRACEMILSAPPRMTVAWCGWGGDYYHLLPGGEDALLAPRTRALVEKLRKRSAGVSVTSHAKRLARRWLGPLRDRALYRAFWRDAVRRVDVFSAPIRPDYELLRAALGRDFRAEYRQFSYASIKQEPVPVDAEIPGQPRTLGLQLGQSASVYGNHLDAALLVPQSARRHVRLVVPLSYGDVGYREELLRELVPMNFGEVDAMNSFLPLHEYQRRLAGSRLAVFNSRRQHALGNIAIALAQGRQVFLDPANPTFNYFRSLGMLVDPMSELPTAIDGQDELSAAERIAHNVPVLDRLWGKAQVISDAQAFVDRLAGVR